MQVLSPRDNQVHCHLSFAGFPDAIPRDLKAYCFAFSLNGESLYGYPKSYPRAACKAPGEIVRYDHRGEEQPVLSDKEKICFVRSPTDRSPRPWIKLSLVTASSMAALPNSTELGPVAQPRVRPAVFAPFAYLVRPEDLTGRYAGVVGAVSI
jgi:hypothetical protein